jgi:uncharacterized protein with NRDE domain
MCLILVAHLAHPDYPLVLAANRDEFHARPTAAAHWWPEATDVLGGRDLQSGGTWLAIARSGRWAGVTNFRDGARAEIAELSRGHLVSDFVTGSLPAEDYLAAVQPREQRYGGYNLLVGDGAEVYWTSNRRSTPPRYFRLSPGIHGVSNHLLDTPWPKVERGRRQLAALLEHGEKLAPDHLLEILLDRTYAADHDLPSTGVPLDLERALSASFTATPGYGTRSSTAILRRRDGGILFAERRFDAEGRLAGEDLIEM